MIQKGLRCRYQSAQYKFEFILKHFATDTSENHHLETSRYMRVVYFRDPKSGNGCNWVRMCFLYCIDISFFLNLNSTGILKILNIVVMKTILFFLHCKFVPILTVNVNAVSIGVSAIGMMRSVCRRSVSNLAFLRWGLLHRGDVQIKPMLQRHVANRW